MKKDNSNEKMTGKIPDVRKISEDLKNNMGNKPLHKGLTKGLHKRLVK